MSDLNKKLASGNKKQDQLSSLLFESRCTCGQLLFKGFLKDSLIEIKCRKCKKILSITGSNILNGIENYFLLYDSSGYVVDTYSSKETILGYKKEELLGKHIDSIDLHVDRDLHENLWKKANMTRFDPLLVETFHKRKNGELVCVQENIQFRTINEKNYAIVSYEVVEKSKGAIYQLNIAPTLENISGPVAEINIDGLITYVSNEFASDLIFGSFEMLGKSFFNFCADEIAETFKTQFSALLHSRKSFSVPYMKLVKKDKSVVRYNLSFITTYQKNNSLRGFVIVNTPPLSVDNPLNNNSL